MRSRVIVIALLFLSTGCAVTTSNIATKRESAGTTEVALPALVAEGDLVYLRDAAALSAKVYDRPLAVPDTPQWEELADVPQPETIPGRRLTPNLTYRVYVNKTRTPAVALIVFRGTFLKADWYSNLRWVTAAIPRVEDHYEQTITIMPDVVKRIRETSGTDTKILAAGHSLGGGLAQTAAYATCGDITTVFAFDSSPVTKNRVRHQCTTGRTAETFYRVYERSEVLSYARFLLRLALGLRDDEPKFVEVKVRLFNAVGIRAHNMNQLANRLDEAISPASTAVGGN
jgi:hypothetical protein